MSMFFLKSASMKPRTRPQSAAPYTSNFYDLESFLPAQVKREEARKQREALKNDEPNVGKLTFGSYQRWLLKKGPDAFD